MPRFPRLAPPLLNSACLWASTLADLEALYASPYTGAVTTRTACHPTKGFAENDSHHQHAFSSSSWGVLSKPPPSEPALNTTHPAPGNRTDLSDISTLNTYGYSPLGLVEYVFMVQKIQEAHSDTSKPVIFSVTGDSKTVAQCWKLLAEQSGLNQQQWCMEINLSCPNIAHRPPPAYSKQQLVQFLAELREHISDYVVAQTQGLDRDSQSEHWNDVVSGCSIPIGIKLPPYTYGGQFDNVAEVVKRFNSEGFGSISIDSKADTTAPDGQPTVPDMTDTSIDPTLLSTADANSYLLDVSSDVFSRLSLDTALNASRAPALESRSLSTDLDNLMRTPLGEFLQTEVFGEPWPISFITSTNTLGSSLIMQGGGQDWQPALASVDGSGIGGIAGAILHPLALGNIANLQKRLRKPGGSEVTIIGVGGVSDSDGFWRMRAAGADFVGLATALGARGVTIFEDIAMAAQEAADSGR